MARMLFYHHHHPLLHDYPSEYYMTLKKQQKLISFPNIPCTIFKQAQIRSETEV